MSGLFRILAVGDVVGTPGLVTIDKALPRLRQRLDIDFVVVNGENAATNGNGLSAKGARRILQAGADVVTLGDHWFRKADLMPLLDDNPALLRPANYPPEAAGRGWGEYASGPLRIGVVVVQGRVFMGEPVDSPFQAAEAALERLQGCDIRLVEVHAEATSEKAALAHHLDGQATAVWGTHTHVATADERLLPAGTAFISDLGMTGPHDGIIGRRAEPVIQKMRTGMPAPFKVSGGALTLSGALVEVDLSSGRARSIERVAEHVDA